MSERNALAISIPCRQLDLDAGRCPRALRGSIAGNDVRCGRLGDASLPGQGTSSGRDISPRCPNEMPSRLASLAGSSIWTLADVRGVLHGSIAGNHIRCGRLGDASLPGQGTSSGRDISPRCPNEIPSRLASLAGSSIWTLADVRGLCAGQSRETTFVADASEMRPYLVRARLQVGTSLRDVRTKYPRD